MNEIDNDIYIYICVCVCVCVGKHDVRIFEDLEAGNFIDYTEPPPDNNLPSIPGVCVAVLIFL